MKNEAQETSKTTEVVFDLVSSLITIGSDEALMSMFTEKYTDDMKMHIATARGGLFKDEAISFVKGIFEFGILIRKENIMAYQLVQRKEQGEVVKTETKVEKPKNVKKSKYYGKQKVLADIEAQDGDMTEQQRLMLKVNDFKNLYSKFNRKMIAVLNGDAEMSDEECRNAIAIITQAENKAKKIL